MDDLLDNNEALLWHFSFKGNETFKQDNAIQLQGGAKIVTRCRPTIIF